MEEFGSTGETRRLAEEKSRELSEPTGYSVWMGKYVTKVEYRNGLAWEVSKPIVAVRGRDEATGKMVTVAYGPRGSDTLPLGVRAAYPLIEEDFTDEEVLRFVQTRGQV